MKDNFSTQADLYSRFRPDYCQQLYDFLLHLIPAKNTAWDCGTGNGQVAVKLSEYFEEVYATDISANQIKNAKKKKTFFIQSQKQKKLLFPIINLI